MSLCRNNRVMHGKITGFSHPGGSVLVSFNVGGTDVLRRHFHFDWARTEFFSREMHPTKSEETVATKLADDESTTIVDASTNKTPNYTT